MIRQKIMDTLAERGPLTIEEIAEAIGVPRATLRTALTSEFYRQVEVDHIEYGRITAWALRPTALRVDGAGRYCLPTTEAA